jgi:hypothetical protein
MVARTLGPLMNDAFTHLLSFTMEAGSTYTMTVTGTPTGVVISTIN